MIIYSRKKRNANTAIVSTKVEEKSTIVNEEIKTLDDQIVQRTKKKKPVSTPMIKNSPVIEENTEDEDLSKWLEEHTED